MKGKRWEGVDKRFTGTKRCRHLFDKSVHVTKYVPELFKPGDERIDGFAKVCGNFINSTLVRDTVLHNRGNEANCGKIWNGKQNWFDLILS
jgi:hypothetical protein